MRMLRRAWMLGVVGSLALALGGCPGAGTSVKRAPRPANLPKDMDLEGESQSVWHDEGQGAMISSVNLLARNRGKDIHVLRVTGVDRLHGPCNSSGWDDSRPVTVQEPIDTVTINAGEDTRIAVIFDAVECYNACDRFAFRVHTEVDGVPVEVTAEALVQRGKPGEEGPAKQPAGNPFP